MPACFNVTAFVATKHFNILLIEYETNMFMYKVSKPNGSP
jgi:hypothetical protein